MKKNAWITGSLTTQAIGVLLIALLVSHAASLAFYQFDLAEKLGATREAQFAEQMVAIRRLVDAAPEGDRERVAHAVGGQAIETHWDVQSFLRAAKPADANLAALQQKLQALFPAVPAAGLRVGYSSTADDAAPHFILISVQLSDGSWINASTALLQIPHDAFTGVLGSTFLMALAIVPLGIWLMRATTRPLRIFAKAAERLGRNVDAEPVPETGPSDVRRTVRAFNDMQSRIRQLLAERTQMLAALSHDLRTPITRLRLRAELIEDSEQQNRMLADLRDMEAMVNSALAYLREDAAAEDVRRIDVSSLLDTIASEASDQGRLVAVEKHAACVISGRPLALKRAFSNLVDNAIKYGDTARIALRADGATAVIAIDDSGPGIPVDQVEAVFQPFMRLETSRSRDTGGVGLGLALARTVFRSHGGDVRLQNLAGGGLRALVRLPTA